MVTDPLDVDGLLASAPTATPPHPETRLGHIHLHIGDLHEGERFYAHTLGLTVTQRTYRALLFLARGRVPSPHWAQYLGPGADGPRRATGLVRYAWQVPAGTGDVLDAHLRAQAVPHARSNGTLELTDPVGIRVDVRDAPPAAPSSV